MNTLALSPGATPMRAALLMLGSTMAFGLMAVAIRYATRYVPTQEVAFFRNAFGLLALLTLVAVACGSLPASSKTLTGSSFTPV